jgi:hypothetical protein
LNDESWKIPTDKDANIIESRQAIIDSLEIHEEFPKKMWNYCIFNKEDYFKKREEEKKINRISKVKRKKFCQEN